MKPGFRVIRVESGRRGTLYTVHIDGREKTEYDRFLDDESCSSSPEFMDVLQRLDNMMNRYGFQDQFFKYEGRPTDSTRALHYNNGPLRLYCCKFGEALLIVGGGGIKTERTYQEQEELNDAEELMQYVDDRLMQSIMDRDTIITASGKLEGKLDFEPLLI